jgi:hypothetical protein
MIKLKIETSEITASGELIITKMLVIDENGHVLRIAKITDELRKLLMSCEIDVTDYISFIEMKKKNTALTKMVTDFNLILTK